MSIDVAGVVNDKTGCRFIKPIQPVRIAILPREWSAQDVGFPGEWGSASFNSNGVWTVTGNGADIWASSDQFYFASRNFVGDASIIARVNTLQNTDPWAKAGLMFRNSTATNAAFAYVMVTPGNGVAFHWRGTDGGVAAGAPQIAGNAPVWLKLTRVGDTFSGYYGPDGTAWTQIGAAQSLAISASARVGLAVTAHDNTALNTSTFSSVTLLPTGWTSRDIGAPALPGSALANTGAATWTVSGGGADIFNTSDQFQFVSRSFQGDGALVARAIDVQRTDQFSKAGVMFRDSIAANAPFAHLFVGPVTIAFECRTAAGANVIAAGYAAGPPPAWLKLVRSGNSFAAYERAKAATCTPLGATQDVAMSSTALAGLAVTAHNNSALNTSAFDNVSLTTSGGLSATLIARDASWRYFDRTNDLGTAW